MTSLDRDSAGGIDVGLNRLATLSTGEGYENQAFLRTALKKLRQANKRLHRRVKGSKNREKARRQVARLHYRITCMRDDVLHKLSTGSQSAMGSLASKTSTLKDYSRTGACLARFGCRLDKATCRAASKLEQRDGQVIQVGRFFPSSKTCHRV